MCWSLHDRAPADQPAVALQSWKDEDAEKAIGMVWICACIAEDSMMDHFPILLPAMCKVRPCMPGSSC